MAKKITTTASGVEIIGGAKNPAHETTQYLNGANLRKGPSEIRGLSFTKSGKNWYFKTGGNTKQAFISVHSALSNKQKFLQKCKNIMTNCKGKK